MGRLAQERKLSSRMLERGGPADGTRGVRIAWERAVRRCRYLGTFKYR